MIKNDRWLRENNQIIQPFYFQKERGYNSYPALSFGTSSYGYDIRLGSEQFFCFQHAPGVVTDPKNFCAEALTESELFHDTKRKSSYYLLPAHTYALGVSKELITMPKNILGVLIGKSTYARCGVILNCTPLEPGWKGYITLELSNSSSSDCRIYADEGIGQILFFEGEPCENGYGEAGKYQNQTDRVTFPTV